MVTVQNILGGNLRRVVIILMGGGACEMVLLSTVWSKHTSSCGVQLTQ